MANSKSRPRRPDVFEPALSNRPTGPRHGDSKVELVKQGVRGVLRSKNLRLLLDAAKAPEDLALLAELPLERLQNMASGALCSDETGYHLEQQLQLPSGWLDRNNTEVPSRFLALLANPNLSLDDLEAVHDAPAPQEAQAKPETALATLSTQAAPEPVTSAQAQEPVAISTASAPAQELATPATVVETPNEALQPTLEPVVEKALPTSKNDENAMTTPAELRLANLQVLLSGKGAKSALARLLQLSPASVTGMLNGVKPLDEELRLTITKVLQLGENWFDKERTEKDIPAAAQKLLSPLPRGATAPTPSSERQSSTKSKATAEAGTANGNASPDNGAAQGAATNAAGAEAGNAPAGAATDGKPASWPAGSKISKLRQITGEGAASDTGAAASGTGAAAGGATDATLSSDSAAAGGEGQALASAAQPQANAPASTRRAAAKSNGTAAGSQAAAGNTPSAPAQPGTQLMSPATESRPIPVQQRGDAAPIVSAVLSDFVLPPIAEALIKTLALKATSGALTEDRAFELLGNVRGL